MFDLLEKVEFLSLEPLIATAPYKSVALPL
jgi:hypothetical protein